MSKLKKKDNEIDSEIYAQKSLALWKYIIGSILLIFFGFFFNYPLEKTIKNTLVKNLSSLKSCPITFQDIELSYFLPKVIITKPVISGRCFNQAQGSLSLNDLTIHLSGPSFYPLGLKFSVDIKKGLSKINLYPLIGIGKVVLKVEKSVLSSDLISEIAGSNPVEGTLAIDALVEMGSKGLSDLKFHVQSKNLAIPSQNLQGLDLPHLNIGTLSLKGEYDGKKVFKVDNFILGNDLSPIVGQMKGNINVNKYNMAFSTLDLNGEVKFTPEFLNDFSILNLLLGGKNQENGFYKVRLGGSLMKPTPTIL